MSSPRSVDYLIMKGSILIPTNMIHMHVLVIIAYPLWTICMIIPAAIGHTMQS